MVKKDLDGLQNSPIGILSGGKSPFPLLLFYGFQSPGLTCHELPTSRKIIILLIEFFSGYNDKGRITIQEVSKSIGSISLFECGDQKWGGDHRHGS